MKNSQTDSLEQNRIFEYDEIPEGWVLKSFMDVFDIEGGTQPPKSTFVYEPQPNHVRLIQIRDFGERPHPTFIRDNKKIKKCIESDILIGRYGASVGRICTGMKGAYNVALAKVIIPNEIDRKFVFFLLQSDLFQKPILVIERSAQNGFNKGDLERIYLPIPPFAEQQRIVTCIEALLANVNIARDRLKKVPVIMKKFRQAVLAAACSGRLTEEWREENPEIKSAKIWIEKTGKKSINLQPNLLIPEYLPNLPISWDFCNVGVISQFIGSGITPKGGKEVYISEGIPFIRSQNVYPDGIRLDDIVFVSEKMHKEMKRTHVFPNDVLLNITGASIGRCTCVPEKFFEANVNQHVCIIRVVSEFLPQYLSIFLNSPLGQKQIFDSQGGVTRQGLNYNQLRAIILPLPPFAEQNEIVRRVNALFVRVDSIERDVAAAAKRTEALTQAVLGKAFHGELMINDSKENSSQ